MGAAKATVFPEPVLLPPIQSLPLRISGMQAFWIAVWRLIAIAERELTSQGARSRDAKDESVSGTPTASASRVVIGSGLVIFFADIFIRERGCRAKYESAEDVDSLRRFDGLSRISAPSSSDSLVEEE